MNTPRSLVFRGNLSWPMRLIAGLLIPVHLATAVPAAVAAAAVIPQPQDSQQPPATAFQQQHIPAKPLVLTPADVNHTVPPGVQLGGFASQAALVNPSFTIPLVALNGNPSEEEGKALKEAMARYAARNDDSRFAEISQFLAAYPKSTYRPVLELNLGLNYLSSAYFLKALAVFREAWDHSKACTDLTGRAIADRAFGELVHLNARLGRFDELVKYFDETKTRAFTGSATELIAGARDGLTMMKNRPGDSFKCGPAALERILTSQNGSARAKAIVKAARSTQKGVNLAEVYQLSQKAGMEFQIARRAPGAPLIYPAVIHWKIGHYSAMIQNEHGFVSFQDPTFGATYTASAAAIDTEASGYFLVPAGPLPKGWSAVSESEAATIWGRGQSNTTDPNQTKEDSEKCKQPECSKGMAVYNAHALDVSLNITDEPVGYAVPVGPSVYFDAIYNQREASQPTIFNYSNFGPKWNSSWIGYVATYEVAYTVNGSTVAVDYPVVHLPGGGIENYIPAQLSVSASLPADIDSQCIMSRASDGSWVRTAPDGSKMVFMAVPGVGIPGTMVGSSGTVVQNFTGYFLAQIVDPFGNTVQLNYDTPTVNAASAARLLSITDAIGQVTTLSYEISSDPLKITKVTDPFGRYASFAYDANSRLSQITDVIGITSQFTYSDASDFISALTTPYGTSNFSYGESAGENGPSVGRWLVMTDPLGGTERVEFSLEGSFADGTAPTGMSTASPYEPHNVTYYWNKRASMAVGLPVTSSPDVSAAFQYHWLVTNATVNNASGSLAATKAANESPVHYNYYGQTGGPGCEGTSGAPAKVGRVLDDGTSQIYSYSYNSAGRVTKATDPFGRVTVYEYDTNNVDLITVKQQNGASFETLSSIIYNAQHLPLTVVDASGQITNYTYNSAGQVHTVTNAKNETTTFWYHPTGQPAQGATLDASATGYLVRIDGPVSGATTNFTYDNYGRVCTATDSQGYTVTTNYDTFNRPVMVTYPDGTYEQILYNRLDAEWLRDRLGRWTHQYFDANRHLVVVVDPLCRKTSYDWCGCGSLNAIIDPAGHRTSWVRDVQSRVMAKIYPDNTQDVFTYENNTSRLKKATDVKGQVANYTYYLDNTLAAVTYTDTTGAALSPATPSVSYSYDPFYPRLSSMTDGVGTTTWTYNPYSAYVSGQAIPVSLGAGRLASVTGPIPNATLAFTYDELGRRLTQSINGNDNLTTVHYDSLARIDTVTNALGTFTLAYVGVTHQLDHIVYPNNQRSNYNFYGNIAAAGTGNGDRRLSSIQNLTPSAANLSSFGYTYDIVGQIATWSKQNDADLSLTASFQYDAIGQLLTASVPASTSVVKNYTYGYDLAGNRTQEQIDGGVTSASYNTLNQLTGLSPGGQMEFAGTVNEPATVTIGGKAATVDVSNNWRGTANVTPGANSIPLVATDGNGNVTTKTIAITVPSGATRTLTSDLNGNEVDNGSGQTYTYDALDRIRTVTQGSNVTEFVYNGFGQCVQQKLNGTVVKQWVWANGAQPVEERDANNVVSKQFFSGFGEQIAGTNYYFMTDHLGSVREMTDGSGAVRARYDYTPWGQSTKLSGDLDSDFGYAGYMRDQATGLWRTRYRLYDADLARWLSRDPIGLRGGINLYRYVRNSPVNRVDPLGLVDTSLDGADPALLAEFGLKLVVVGVLVKVVVDVAQTMPTTSTSSPQSCPIPAPKVTTPVTPPPPKGPCFPAGTIVSTPDGKQRIEDIKTGDLVYAYDFQSGQTIECKVVEPLRHFTYHWVDIEIGSEKITATRGHLFWVENEKRWVAAVDLEAGMALRLEDGSAVVVSGTIVHDLTQAETTYNLLVESAHNYYVGNLQVLVHNGGEAAPPSGRGSPPVGDDGYPIELHHEGQSPNGQLREMTRTDHRLGENYAKNHTNTGQEESKIDRTEFNKIRRDYWKKEWDRGRWNNDDDDDNDDGCD